jgi:hypothetical protein
MKNRMVGLLLVIVLAAVLPSPAMAQLNQTGTLAGTAVDNQKQPLPGVTVTIKSPAIILPQMDTISGPGGRYRFLSLPPGLYEITFSLDGFDSFVRKEIRIGVGQTTTIDATLEQTGLSKTIVVVGESPTLDIRSTTNSTNLDRSFLQTAPAARNVDAFFNMAPGVTAELNNPSGLMSSANGSGVRDNSFNLDGVNVTDPMVGIQAFGFGMDFIEEISIKSAGLPAEFGDATGAHINVVTRSGSNRLSGSASFYYTGDKLQSNNTAGTPLEASQSGYQYVVEPGITLGGPIVKDKLWFFTNLSFNSKSRNVAGFPYDQPTQVPAKDFTPYPFIKLTFQPSQSDRFSLSYSYTDFRQNNAGASMFMTEAYTPEWTAPTHVINFQWMKSFSSSFYGDFKVAYVTSQQNILPKSSGATYYDLGTGQYSGAYYAKNLYHGTRFQSNANGTYFAEGLAGTHEFKAGVEVELGSLAIDQTWNIDPRNGMALIYTYLGTPLYGLALADTKSEQAGTSFHVYLQDSWKPSKRLTLNLGLRFTYQDGRIPAQNQDEGEQTFLGITYNRSVTESFKAFSRTAPAPRLGLIYDLTGDGKTLFKASYSRYIQANVILYFASANPNQSFYYAQALFPDFTPVPDAYLAAFFPNPSKVGFNGSGLKAPYTDEFSVALEREILPNWSLSGRYFRKADRRLVEDVDASQLEMDTLMNDGELVWTNWTQVPFTDPYNGEEGHFWSQNAIVGNDYYLVNPPGATRDFDGLEFALNKHYAQGWYLMASYVWQNSRGLIGNDFSSTIVTTGLFSDPNTHVNAYGQMDLERRNQFKLQAMATGPWGISFSGFFRYYSGQRYTRTVVSTDLGVAVNQGQAAIFAEPRGSQMLPALPILDLRVEKSFNLGRTSFSLFADAFNVFNGSVATAAQAVSSSPALVFGEMTAIQDPRTFRLGFRFIF